MSAEIGKAFEVKWRIENIKPWFEIRDDALYSPRFLAETLSNTSWKLRLSPNTHNAEKYISLAIERDVEDDSPEQVAVCYELSFLASDGSTLKSKTCTSKFAPKSVSQELIVKEVDIFREKKESYLPGGVLSVCCKMWKRWSSASKGGQCSLNSVIGKKPILLHGTIDNFSSLNSDVNVMVNVKSFSSDISSMSFGVKLLNNWTLSFETKKTEYKHLNFYSCKLFVMNNEKEIETSFDLGEDLTLLFSKDESPSFCIKKHDKFIHCLENDSLALQLGITYYPAVKSERIEYNDNNYKQIDESRKLESLNLTNAEQVRSHPPKNLRALEEKKEEYSIEKNKPSDEDESFDVAERVNLPSTTLKEDMASLYNDKLFCDTKLITKTETFPAHRNVLSARSPVFKKMFTTDMKEKSGEGINITDISSDTVGRMLQFLYTDCTGDLDMQSAKDLYIASDKYDIASLKQRCSSFMKTNFCPANVCEILVLADMHQDKNLESAAQEYVLINDEVFYSDEWKCFMENYGCLAAKLKGAKLLEKTPIRLSVYKPKEKVTIFGKFLPKKFTNMASFYSFQFSR